MIRLSIKNVITTVVILAAVVTATGYQQITDVENDERAPSCEPSKTDPWSIISVGLLSAIVFALVGILPAVFIRTDADEAKFGTNRYLYCV